MRDWIREDEDQFTTRPFKMGDYIVHTRIVRGTQGVRVSATDGKTGDAIWEVDLGVPIATLEKTESGGIAAINSQAALYSIEVAAIAAEKPLNASENPGAISDRCNSPIRRSYRVGEYRC